MPDWGLLSITSVAIVLIQLAFLRQPFLSDQLDYFSSARDLPDVSASHRHLRIGLLGPTRFAIWLFGYSELAYYIVPGLTVIALSVGTFILGLRLANRWVGASAALLVTLNPYVLLDSSHLLPDLTATALLTFAVLALIVAEQDRQRLSDRAFLGYLLMAGVLFGWSYLTREYIVLLLPLAAIVWRMFHWRIREGIAVASGIGVMVSVELIYGFYAYGNPLVRAQVLSRRGSRNAGQHTVEPLDALWTFPGELLTRSGGLVWIGLIAMCLALPFLARRSPLHRQTAIVIAGWAIGVWVLLTVIEFMPALPGGRRLLRLHKIRYWSPLMPALVLAGLTGVWLAVQHLVRGRVNVQRITSNVAVVILASFTAWVGVSSVANSGVWTRTGSGEYLELRAFLHDAQPETIWMTHGTGRSSNLVFEMYTRTWYGRPIWQGEVRNLLEGGEFRPEEQLDEGMILHYPFSLAWAVRNVEGPDYLANWPGRWTPVFISSNGELGLLDLNPAEGGRSEPIKPEESWQAIEDAQGVVLTGRGFEASIAAGERLRMVDGRGSRFQAPATQELTSTETNLVMGTVRLERDQSSRSSLRCLFFDPAGQRSNVRPLWFPGLGTETVKFACRPPSGFTSATVRLHVDMRGPATVRFEEVELYWVTRPSHQDFR